MFFFRFLIGLLSSIVAIVLTFPIIVIGLPVWFVVIIQKTIYAILRSMRPLPVSADVLVQYQPVLGWKPKPNLNTYTTDLAGNKYKLTTDEHGWRRSMNGMEENDVFVFGDSFAFGFGANDNEFFANVISRPRIKAIGASGYNMVQELMLMEEYAPLLKDKTVIWFIYHGNDLYENLTPNMEKYRMPFLRELNGTSEWETVTSHVNPSYWSINTKRDYYGKLAEICSDTPLSRRAFSACEYLIKRGKKICVNQNSKLIIFSLPDIIQIDPERIPDLAVLAPDKNTFDPDLPDKELKRICDIHTVPFYTMKDYLTPSHFINRDVHWNSEGNKRVADVIKEIYTNCHS